MADIYHGVFATAPAFLKPVLENALVLGTSCGVLLNLVTRIGIRQLASIRLDPGHVDREAVEKFLTEQGSHWAARRDIINRATFGAVQLLELLGEVPGGIALEARFDEFNLDLRVRYTGAPLEFPERRPSAREIMASGRGGTIARRPSIAPQRRSDQFPRTGRTGRGSPALRPLITMPVCASGAQARLRRRPWGLRR